MKGDLAVRVRVALECLSQRGIDRWSRKQSAKQHLQIKCGPTDEEDSLSPLLDPGDRRARPFAIVGDGRCLPRVDTRRSRDEGFPRARPGWAWPCRCPFLGTECGIEGNDLRTQTPSKHNPDRRLAGCCRPRQINRAVKGIRQLEIPNLKSQIRTDSRRSTTNN